MAIVLNLVRDRGENLVPTLFRDRFDLGDGYSEFHGTFVIGQALFSGVQGCARRLQEGQHRFPQGIMELAGGRGVF